MCVCVQVFSGINPYTYCCYQLIALICTCMFGMYSLLSTFKNYCESSNVIPRRAISPRWCVCVGGGGCMAWAYNACRACQFRLPPVFSNGNLPAVSAYAPISSTYTKRYLMSLEIRHLNVSLVPRPQSHVGRGPGAPVTF